MCGKALELIAGYRSFPPVGPFKSITENIDTTTSGGKLVFHIFGALAEFERDINEASPQQAAGYHKEGHCL